MINLQLKAKHYYLVADMLFSKQAFRSFSILEKIKTACTGLADDDLVEIEIDIESVITVFRELSYKPEGSFNQINSEMLDLILPQLTTGTTMGNQEWITLGQKITEIRTQNLAVVTNAIQSGKNKLYN